MEYWSTGVLNGDRKYLVNDLSFKPEKLAFYICRIYLNHYSNTPILHYSNHVLS
jgi:hypothetical protein